MRSLFLWIAVAITACGGGPEPETRPTPRGEPPRSSKVITRDQIIAWNATDALDAIARSGSAFRVSGQGVVSRRGEMSISDRDASIPVVYVDQVRMPSAQVLRDIPAAEIDRIEFLSAMDAATRFGAVTMAGAILVTTRRGSLEGSPPRR